MKPGTSIVFAILIVLALLLGWFGRGILRPDPPSPEGSSSANSGVCPDNAEPLYWRAPMDPTYIREEPGKSPMGMDLVPECPSTGGGAPRAGVVQVDAATVQTIGVRTTRVERTEIARTTRAVGRVTHDERLVSHAHTKVQGWVERLSVDYVGQTVERGQSLLEIYSPELVATQEELILAARYREATANSPFDDVRGGGAALLKATRRRLELWDIPERDIERLLRTGEIRKTLTLYAPTGGVVTHLGVRTGMEVQPNQNLYTIVDLSKVWVIADIYESDLPWVELGQTGEIKFGYLPGESFSGAVTYIAPFLDPTTRTAAVRLELDNEAGHLKPEMFGDVVLHGVSRGSALVVPSEAVIRTGERTLVVVALGAGRFEPRNVILGLESGVGSVEIREGLTAGDEIVISSQFLIDSESQLREAVSKLLAPSQRDRPDESTSPPVMDEGQDGDRSMQGMDH